MKILILFSAMISLSAFSKDPETSVLNIYVAPPERELNWSSPGKLYSSLFMSRVFLTKRPFGSAGADLYCREDKGTHSISVDPEKFDVMAPVLFQGKGLGFLYSAHPGKLLTQEKAVEKNRAVINTPGARFITFLISDAHCSRIKKYWKEFEANNISRNFGLPHRPLMGEGATDTALVVSSLEVSGFLVPDQREKWERVIFLPKDLSGAPLSDNWIFPFSLLGDDWGKSSQNSFVLRFWDPDLIAKWIDEQITTKKSLKKLSDVTRGIPGIQFDLSRRPVSEGNIWEQANDPAYSKPRSL